MKYAG